MDEVAIGDAIGAAFAELGAQVATREAAVRAELLVEYETRVGKVGRLCCQCRPSRCPRLSVVVANVSARLKPILEHLP